MIPEGKGYSFFPIDLQILQKSNGLQIPQGLLRRLDAASPLSLYHIVSPHLQRNGALRVRLRQTLKIGHDANPLPAVSEIEPEKGLHVREIPFQNPIVHTPGSKRSACHQNAILHRKMHPAGQAGGKGRIANIIKAALPDAVGKGRDRELRPEHPRRVEHRIGSAGDVQRAVGTARNDPPQGLECRHGVKHSGADKLQLHLYAPMGKIGLHPLPELLMLRELLRAEIDDPGRTKHLNPQDIFQGPFIVEFYQCLHDTTSRLKK